HFFANRFHFDSLSDPQQVLKISIPPARRPDDKDRVIILAPDPLIVINIMLQTQIAIVQPAVDEEQEISLATLLQSGLDRFLEITGHFGFPGNQLVPLLRAKIVEQAVAIKLQNM